MSLDDGSSVLVEVDDALPQPVMRGRPSPGATVVAAGQSLDGAMAQLASMTQSMLLRLRSLADTPNEIEVEFSVKLNAEARVVIAQAGGEANFRIAMRWTPDAR